jgi:hypothetical protein
MRHNLPRILTVGTLIGLSLSVWALYSPRAARTYGAQPNGQQTYAPSPNGSSAPTMRQSNYEPDPRNDLPQTQPTPIAKDKVTTPPQGRLATVTIPDPDVSVTDAAKLKGSIVVPKENSSNLSVQAFPNSPPAAELPKPTMREPNNGPSPITIPMLPQDALSAPKINDRPAIVPAVAPAAKPLTDAAPTNDRLAVLPTVGQEAETKPYRIVSEQVFEYAPENSSKSDGDSWMLLPRPLLFQTFMANPLSPRTSILLTSLNNTRTSETIDTAIGGEFGMMRATTSSGLAVQLDVLAVVFSRFSRRSDFIADDYRVGIPLTFAYNDWHGKIAYEHTSTHLGDDYIKDNLVFRQANIHDEAVIALDHLFWNQLRIYGQFAYAFYAPTPTNSPVARYGWGVEWSKYVTTGWAGQPFAAFDMDLRGDQNYAPNYTLQVGWQWKDMEHGGSLRFGFEAYHGHSPYGQFYRDKESWYGVGLWYDF